MPVSRYLVPPDRPPLADQFQSVDEPLLGGLPHRISLFDGLALVLVVPNGLARAWREADPGAVVTQSSEETDPRDPTAVPLPPPAPAGLFLQQNGSVLAGVPLKAGLRRLVPDAGQPSGEVRVELALISWDIRAGSLRGPGDFGSRIRLAWRRADLASASFAPPGSGRRLAFRLPQEFRLESSVGLEAVQ